MKVVKPLRLGLLHKVFEHRRQPYLTVSLFVCFSFEAPARFLYESSMWKIAGEELGKNAILDECMSKQRGELLVGGRCFAPGRAPCRGTSVRVRLGAADGPVVDKTLYVFGDRRWELFGMSEPEPFTEMPLGWRNAFGGEGHAANPLGKGMAPVRTRGHDGDVVHPLPNVEDPRHLVKGPGDRPVPAGFEGYDITWPQRAAKMGTYDEAWVKEDFPGLARDLDYGFFNTAPPDQQIEGYFRGDETFLLEHLHPDKPRLEGALPGVTTRCFLTQKAGEEQAFRELAMRLDTVRLFPHRERGILVFRGALEIREDDAADVVSVLAACEAMDAPKPVDHYRTVLAQRLDKKTRQNFLMRDEDLMPAPEAPGVEPLPDDRLSGIAMLMKREGFVHKHTKRRPQEPPRATDEGRTEEVRKELQARGLDPDRHLPPRPPPPPAPSPPPAREPPNLENLGDYVEQVKAEMERSRAQADEERLRMDDQARAACAKVGQDFDVLVRKGRQDAGTPTKASALDDLRNLRARAPADTSAKIPWTELEAKLAEADVEPQIREQQAAQRATDRRFAHYFPAAERLEGDPAKRLREEVIAGHAAGQSFAGRDLTGADLSHLDLHGIDLDRAVLESAVLTGADLSHANLSGAIFAHADLSGADLSFAKLTGASFGSAILRDVKARGGLDLDRATFAKADLSGADFTGASLASADFSEAIFQGADFSNVTGKKLFFLRVDLSGATFAGADLQRCAFLEVDVSDVDFSGANLSASSFITAQGDGAVFRGAKLDKLRMVKDSSFAGADFRGASMQRANLMGTRLDGAELTGADLRSAVLNDADLSGATLDRAVLVEAMLIRTNLTGASLYAVDLMHAVLQKAILRGADLEKSNLFGADAGRMIGDDETSFSGANVKRVSFVAARRPDEQG